MSDFLQVMTPAPHVEGVNRFACIEVLTVGDPTSWIGERIVEIAIATTQGRYLTTIVNPRTDLFTARTDHGLTTRDVQLAPTLSDAWPVIEQLITGHALVGIHPEFLMHALARELRDIDADALPAHILPFEPYRLSRSDQRNLYAGGALRTASGMVAHPEGVEATLEQFELAVYEPTGRRRPGYLMNRTSDAPDEPLGGTITLGGDLGAKTPPQALAELLARAWERVVDPDDELVDRIRAIEDECRIGILPRYYDLPAQPDPAELLDADPVITISGWYTPDGAWSIGSDVIALVLERLGMRSSRSLLSREVAVDVSPRDRTDLLLVSERGSQSRKVKNAVRHGVPIMTVRALLEHISTHPLPDAISARALASPPRSVADISEWIVEEAKFVVDSDWV